ncbi:MAG: ABC transporter permease [Gammaproteobacteria bacterium]
MNPFIGFSSKRLVGMVIKEFIQMKRDRPTLAMMVVMPMMQLTLFGFAINTNPKHLPTALVSYDNSIYTYDFVSALENTDYFRITHMQPTEAKANELMERGDVQFILHIPPNFTRDLVRGDHPTMLFEADGTDPAASSNAVSSVQKIAETALTSHLRGALGELIPEPQPFELRTHLRYNPLMITRYNIVPGLLGVVLTMTLVVIASLAMTRERERGTFENLLSTPIRPVEVIFGKILPFVFVAYSQITLILLAAKFIFGVPMQGSIMLLLLMALPFVACNLAVGITFSTLAKNQLQAVQAGMFFFLPSILLSGFMFPFRGMPEWAQFIGGLLPLTHFLRIVRGILLKGNGFFDVFQSLWPMLLFMCVMMVIAISRFRQTLD